MEEVELIYVGDQRVKMHRRLAVKNSLVDSGLETTKLKLGGNELPVCPKPCRPRPAMPEFLKPLKCNKHSQQKADGRSEILNMIGGKVQQQSDEGRESVCTGCSPSCYCGSPPSRADNPLVHDVQFVHQMELLSPLMRTKLSDRFGGAGFSSDSPF